MNNNKIEDKEIAYSILEVKYIKAMGREISIDPRANRDLYPSDWYSNGNIVKKSKILMEAVEKKCLIIETKGYAEIEEGIKKNDNEGVER